MKHCDDKRTMMALLFCICGYSACMYTCTQLCLVPLEAGEDSYWQLSCGCWESNVVPLNDKYCWSLSHLSSFPSAHISVFVEVKVFPITKSLANTSLLCPRVVRFCFWSESRTDVTPWTWLQWMQMSTCWSWRISQVHWFQSSVLIWKKMSPKGTSTQGSYVARL